MVYARQYSKPELNSILINSEGRLSPVSNEPGHAFSKHVGVSGQQISDRLVGKLKSDRTHPIVMDSQGRISSETDHRDIWKALNPNMNTRKAKSDFRTYVENWVTRSGSFLDRPQAINVGRYMLNSQAGQAELAKLDSSENRIGIQMFLNQLDMIRRDAWKMYYAEHGNDITHLETFSKAFMLVDKLSSGGIHIQTFFPIK